MIKMIKSSNPENFFDRHTLKMQTEAKCLPEVIHSIYYFLIGCGYSEEIVENYINIHVAENDIGELLRDD